MFVDCNGFDVEERQMFGLNEKQNSYRFLIVVCSESISQEESSQLITQNVFSD